jgi:putative ABC transport system permease protein
MPTGLFLALYRIALRLAPRALRERHFEEQFELIYRMLQEEAPAGLIAGTIWKFSRLARAACASMAAHVDSWRVQPGLNGMTGDIRFALRSLRRSPWYAGSTVVVLGAGTALAAVVFAIVDGVLFKPLPYPAADRLVVVDAQITARPSAKLTAVSWAEIDIWSSAVPEVTLTAISAMASPFNRKEGVSQVLRYTDEHFFDVVGLHPEFGSFLPEDFEWRNRLVAASGPRPSDQYLPVVITQAVWRQDFGMDPSVIGRRITRSERGGSKFGIIIRGVLPPNFVFPLDSGGRQPDVLAPEGLALSQRQRDTRRNFHVLARLAPSTSPSAVEARLREVTQRESRLRPSTENVPHGGAVQPSFDALTLAPIADHLGASARPALRLIAGGAALLLLIICLNVTGLATARGVDRAADFATRRALGASSCRLATLVGLEVLVLAAGGVSLGVWLAQPLLATTVGLLPQSLVLLKTPAIDTRVILAMAIATLTSAVLIAALPALLASRFDLAPAGSGRAGRNARATGKAGLS